MCQSYFSWKQQKLKSNSLKHNGKYVVHGTVPTSGMVGSRGSKDVLRTCCPSASPSFAVSFVSHVKQRLHTRGTWGAPGLPYSFLAA